MKLELGRFYLDFNEENHTLGLFETVNEDAVNQEADEREIASIFVEEKDTGKIIHFLKTYLTENYESTVSALSLLLPMEGSFAEIVKVLENQLRLERLAPELIGEIASFLPYQALRNLSQTSYTMFKKCQHPLERRLEREAKTLLSHVVKGEEEQALKILDGRPELLLKPSEAVDYSGRSFKEVTPFQAALLAHDVTLWKKMEPYFKKLPNGEAEKATQFNKVFPNGLPEQKPYDFSVLIEVITTSSPKDIQAALEKQQNNTAICQALNTFRQGFTNVSMNELFFNPWHLIKAFKVYNQQFNLWNVNQQSVFWSQVVGYVQRFLPACYAQACCQGLDKNKPCSRAFNIENSPMPFFPLAELAGVGFDFGVYSFSTLDTGSPGARASDGRSYGSPLVVHVTMSRLENYVEQISQNYLDLSVAYSMFDSPLRTATP